MCRTQIWGMAQFHVNTVVQKCFPNIIKLYARFILKYFSLKWDYSFQDFFHFCNEFLVMVIFATSPSCREQNSKCIFEANVVFFLH